MEILIIIALILLNGIFAMSEIAIISSRKPKLMAEAQKGSKSAQTVLHLFDNLNRFLSTTQVGITLIGILTGIYSGDVLAVELAPVLQNIGISPDYAYGVAQVVIIIVVTFFSIIFGELVPKRIGISSAEKVAKMMATPMLILSKIAAPFVFLLSKTTAFIFGLFGFKDADTTITEEEIRTMVKEGSEGGDIQQVEQKILERVFTLGDRRLESIMTHRSEVVAIDIHMSATQISELINTYSHSKYPVVDKNLDNLKGFLLIKDLFGKIDKPDFDIHRFIQPMHYFAENMEVYKALEEMKEKQMDYIFICDEFGAFQGIVSHKDILEALVGDILEPDEEYGIVVRNDGSYLVDGQCSFYDFLHLLGIDNMYSQYPYNTLGGLILNLFHRIPHAGEIIHWEGYIIEIMDMDGTRIDKVLVYKDGVSNR